MPKWSLKLQKCLITRYWNIMSRLVIMSFFLYVNIPSFFNAGRVVACLRRNLTAAGTFFLVTPVPSLKVKLSLRTGLLPALQNVASSPGYRLLSKFSQYFSAPMVILGRAHRGNYLY